MGKVWTRVVSATETPASRIAFHIFALAWLGLSVAGLAYVIKDDGPFVAMLVLALLVFIGVWWIRSEVRMAFAFVHAGNIKLILEDALPTIGGRLKATLRLPGNAARASHGVAELVCVRDAIFLGDEKYDGIPFGPGVLWSMKHDLPVRHEGDAGFADIAFEIPAAALPTGTWESASDEDR